MPKAGASLPCAPGTSRPWPLFPWRLSAQRLSLQRPSVQQPSSQGRRIAALAGLARLAGVVLLLGVTAPRAGASSPDAWRAYDQEVRTACLKASRLSQTRVLGGRVDVPVADPPPAFTPIISALLLEGRYPQPHMAGQKGRELCLFEQRTRRATVAEADNLDKPLPKLVAPKPLSPKP